MQRAKTGQGLATWQATRKNCRKSDTKSHQACSRLLLWYLACTYRVCGHQARGGLMHADAAIGSYNNVSTTRMQQTGPSGFAGMCCWCFKVCLQASRCSTFVCQLGGVKELPTQCLSWLEATFVSLPGRRSPAKQVPLSRTGTCRPTMLFVLHILDALLPPHSAHIARCHA